MSYLVETIYYGDTAGTRLIRCTGCGEETVLPWAGGQILSHTCPEVSAGVGSTGTEPTAGGAQPHTATHRCSGGGGDDQ